MKSRNTEFTLEFTKQKKVLGEFLAHQRPFTSFQVKQALLVYLKNYTFYVKTLVDELLYPEQKARFSGDKAALGFPSLYDFGFHEINLFPSPKEMSASREFFNSVWSEIQDNDTSENQLSLLHADVRAVRSRAFFLYERFDPFSESLLSELQKEFLSVTDDITFCLQRGVDLFFERQKAVDVLLNRNFSSSCKHTLMKAVFLFDQKFLALVDDFLSFFMYFEELKKLLPLEQNLEKFRENCTKNDLLFDKFLNPVQDRNKTYD